MVEQRQHLRASVDLVVKILHDGREIVGAGRDMSIGGVFVATHEKIPFGARVVLHVGPSTNLPAMQIEAVCRWSGPEGVGVQFGLMGARETHAITEMCRPRE